MPIQLSGDLASANERAQPVSLASWAAPLPTLTSSRTIRITFGGPAGWSCACVTEPRETNRDTTAKRNRVFFTVFNLLFIVRGESAGNQRSVDPGNRLVIFLETLRLEAGRSLPR